MGREQGRAGGGAAALGGPGRHTPARCVRPRRRKTAGGEAAQGYLGRLRRVAAIAAGAVTLAGWVERRMGRAQRNPSSCRDLVQQMRSEEHTSELQYIMRSSNAV